MWEVVDALEAAVGEVELAVGGGAVGRGGCADPEAAARLRRVVDRVDGLCTRVLAGFARSGAVPARFGSLGNWWTHQVHALRTEAPARLAVQRVLDVLPGFAGGLAEGRVGQAHLRLLAPVVTDARLALARRDEAVLLEAAEQLDPSRFRRVVARWESLADDELGDPTRPELVSKKRRVRLVVRQDGSWWLEGVLEPLVGEALSAALESAMGPKTADDERSGAQRRHDALGDVANTVLRLGSEASAGGAPAQVSVVVEATTGTATLSSGIVLPHWERDYLLCESDLTIIAVTASGAPFEAGGPYKMIPVKTRRAVTARDVRCRFPGCDCPARWCDVHHLVWQSCRGDNRITNLVLLCRRHHRLVHKQRLRCRLDPGDGVTFTVEHPDGTTLVDKPPDLHWKHPPDRVADRARRRARALTPPTRTA